MKIITLSWRQCEYQPPRTKRTGSTFEGSVGVEDDDAELENLMRMSGKMSKHHIPHQMSFVATSPCSNQQTDAFHVSTPDDIVLAL